METHKGALSLLQDYGDNSSDEEVPFGRVSTKRSYKEDEENESTKKLFLPSIISTKEIDNHLDDPSIHDGRIRSFPHERDSWATYVYISCEPNEGIQHIIKLIDEHIPDIKSTSDFHISLTKVVVLRYHWIESFVTTLKDNLGLMKRFLIMFDSLKVYCNEDRTRTFIGFVVKTGYDTLAKLVEILDKCLNEFRLPKFYEEKRFHMSIAWCLGDQEENIKQILPELNDQLLSVMSDYPEDYWYIIVDRLECKIGNKYFSFGTS
nr:U6 snRNA phosphodiesterase [Onthophagus taurus]